MQNQYERKVTRRSTRWHLVHRQHPICGMRGRHPWEPIPQGAEGSYKVCLRCVEMFEHEHRVRVAVKR